MLIQQSNTIQEVTFVNSSPKTANKQVKEYFKYLEECGANKTEKATITTTISTSTSNTTTEKVAQISRRKAKAEYQLKKELDRDARFQSKLEKDLCKLEKKLHKEEEKNIKRAGDKEQISAFKEKLSAFKEKLSAFKEENIKREKKTDKEIEREEKREAREVRKIERMEKREVREIEREEKREAREARKKERIANAILQAEIYANKSEEDKEDVKRYELKRIERKPHKFYRLPKFLLNEPNFVLEAIKLHTNQYLDFVLNHTELSNNKNFIANAMIENPNFFKVASKELQEDFDLIELYNNMQNI